MTKDMGILILDQLTENYNAGSVVGGALGAGAGALYSYVKYRKANRDLDQEAQQCNGDNYCLQNIALKKQNLKRNSLLKGGLATAAGGLAGGVMGQGVGSVMSSGGNANSQPPREVNTTRNATYKINGREVSAEEYNSVNKQWADEKAERDREWKAKWESKF